MNVQDERGALPLSDFREGQWWISELDAWAETGSDDQKRAVAVVHRLLRAVRAASTSANVAQPIHTIGGVPVDHSDDVSITREEYENLLRIVANVAQSSLPVVTAVYRAASDCPYVGASEDIKCAWADGWNQCAQFTKGSHEGY